MKVPHSNAAGHRYVWTRDHLGSTPGVPDQFEVHAILFDPEATRHVPHTRRKWTELIERHEVAFLDYDNEVSACGKRCRMIFPLSFDTAEPDACPKCLEMVELWLNDRPEYERLRSEREAWITRKQDDELALGEEMDRALQRQAADIAGRKREQERKDTG
ncbi:MAG: hypothetical protein KDB26_05190 [Microthrixaceae bacterium]|nr:hypothetical protein [Microthrixaceae bacterium]